MRAGDRLARHRRAVDMGDPHIHQAGLGVGATLPQGDDVAGGGLAEPRFAFEIRHHLPPMRASARDGARPVIVSR